MFQLSDYVAKRYADEVRAHFPERGRREIDVQLEECVKYLIIESEREGSFVPLTGPADEVWHELIVQTRDYERLCRSLPGRKFVHHSSLEFGEYASTRTQEQIIDEFLSWIPAYVGRFGPFTEERAACWSFCGFLMEKLGITLGQLNAVCAGGGR